MSAEVRGIWSPGARVIGGCEPLDTGAGNWTRVLVFRHVLNSQPITPALNLSNSYAGDYQQWFLFTFSLTENAFILPLKDNFLW